MKLDDLLQDDGNRTDANLASFPGSPVSKRE